MKLITSICIYASGVASFTQVCICATEQGRSGDRKTGVIMTPTNKLKTFSPEGT